MGKDVILVYPFGFRMKIKKIMMIFFHFEIIFIEKLLIDLFKTLRYDKKQEKIVYVMGLSFFFGL